MKILTNRQSNIRRFFFREMVASHDARICKSGNGPMVLTWREARDFCEALDDLREQCLCDIADCDDSETTRLYREAGSAA